MFFSIGNIARHKGYPGPPDYATTVTAAGSADAKGAWAELVASTDFEAGAFSIEVLHWSQADSDILWDVGIGAAESEVSIVDNLIYAVGKTYDYRGVQIYHFPLPIPAGTRISARCQAEVASSTIGLATQIYDVTYYSQRPPGRITTYGANTDDTDGVVIDPGAVANTKGAWIEITSSLTHDIQGFMWGITSNQNHARATYTFKLDIGIGADESEVVIVSNHLLTSYTIIDVVFCKFSPYIPISIPAGTRISARAACSGIDASDRLFGIIFYGIS